MLHKTNHNEKEWKINCPIYGTTTHLLLPERRVHFPLIDVLRLDWTNEIDLLKNTITSDIHIAPMISTKYTTSTVMSENERLHAFEELRKLRQCEEYNFISKDLWVYIISEKTELKTKY